jgi:glycosyltransferase involved in cell wall biosynthesis
MKIVYFIDHLRPDGTQRVLQQLVEGMAKRGHAQAVICLNNSWDAEVVRQLRANHAEVRFVGKAALASGYGIAATWYWLQRRECDVVVTLLFFSDVVGRAIAHAARVPRIVSSIRARNANYARWQRALVRRTMPWADAVVLNSAAIRDFAIDEEGAQRDRIIVIPNGVRVDDYLNPISRTMLRAEFGLEPERILLGSVGRLTHQKGLDLLITSLAQLAEPNADLLLIGAGEQEERVHFAGYREDVPRLLGALDLYIHPARFEGMPNAVLEAMAAGCAIVASAVDGTQELIEEGVHGWLVPPEDSEALAQALQHALSNQAEAARRAAAAQQRAMTHFSVSAMIEAWESVITEDSGQSS